MKRQELLQRPVHESFEGRLRRADRVCKRARHQRSSGACQMVQECVWFPDFFVLSFSHVEMKGDSLYGQR